jgi:opacity protein-like surface antigen
VAGTARFAAHHFSNDLSSVRSEVCERLKEIRLLKMMRLFASASALMLEVFGFLGLAVQAHGQQLMLKPSEVSSSASSELPEAPEPEATGGGAGQTGKTKLNDVSEFNVTLGVTAQLTATRTAEQLNSQNIVGTTPSAGFLATFQQQIRPLVGYDINFGYTRLTENYERNTSTLIPPSGATSGFFLRGSIPANMFEISSAYTVKRRQNGSRYQPFAEAGGGVLIFSPTTAPFEGHSSYRAALLFGGGVDYRINANWGLRAEYRGLMYKNPDFAAVISTVPVSKFFTVTSEPTVSIRYHFGKHGGMQ